MSAAQRTFRVSSVLAAPTSDVWASASSIDGINYELGPFLKMTCPAAATRLDPATVPLGVTLFRSWILLFGAVPVDYDDLRLIRIEPGVGFQEESTMLSQKVWRHERRIEENADGGGCKVTDVVSFEPRLLLRPFGWIWEQMTKQVFRWRHRRLRRRFGMRPPA